MKPDFANVLQTLDQAISTWNGFSAQVPEQIPIPQAPNALAKDAIPYALAEIRSLLEGLGQRDDIDPLRYTIQYQGIQNQVTGLRNTLSTAQGNPRNTGALWNAVSHIWGLYTGIVWIVPPEFPGALAEAIRAYAEAASVAPLPVSIKAIVESASVSAQKTGDITRLLTEAQQSTDRTKASEREAGTAKTNAQASAAAAEADKKQISISLRQLQEGVATVQHLADEVSSLQEQAERALEATSKVGLAKAFSDRRAELEKSTKTWRLMVIGGILAMLAEFLVLSGLEVWFPALAPHWYLSIAVRVAAEAPLVWFTWWAVRQYGHSKRLEEDYAFKEAEALSFVGYRREMSDDAEMLKLLRESAIRAFGANPVRVLGKGDPASPVHDLFENALEKVGPDKLMELLKTVVQSALGRK